MKKQVYKKENKDFENRRFSGLIKCVNCVKLKQHQAIRTRTNKGGHLILFFFLNQLKVLGLSIYVFNVWNSLKRKFFKRILRISANKEQLHNDWITLLSEFDQKFFS